MKQQLLNIQGLECLHVAGQAAETAIVIFHGYGANMHDLFPLWELWNKDHFNWFFPNGVLELSMGHYGGRAWTSIDMASIELAMRTGTHRDLKDFIPPEFKDTRERLEKFLQDIQKQYKRLIIGGFSQGAMMSAHLAMSKELTLDGLILLSGNLVAESLMPKEAHGIPFYQAHGTHDPVLSLKGARELESRLLSMGFSGKLYEFEGGHEVPYDVIRGVSDYLKRF